MIIHSYSPGSHLSATALGFSLSICWTELYLMPLESLGHRYEILHRSIVGSVLFQIYTILTLDNTVWKSSTICHALFATKTQSSQSWYFCLIKTLDRKLVVENASLFDGIYWCHTLTSLPSLDLSPSRCIFGYQASHIPGFVPTCGPRQHTAAARRIKMCRLTTETLVFLCSQKDRSKNTFILTHAFRQV